MYVLINDNDSCSIHSHTPSHLCTCTYADLVHVHCVPATIRKAKEVKKNSSYIANDMRKNANATANILYAQFSRRFEHFVMIWTLDMRTLVLSMLRLSNLTRCTFIHTLCVAISVRYIQRLLARYTQFKTDCEFYDTENIRM